MGQHQLCDANADHTAHRGPGHEGRGEEQDEKRIQLPQLSPDIRCGKAVQDPASAGTILPQPLRQGLHRQRLRIHLGGRAPLLPRLCESHLPQAAEEVRPTPHPLSRPAPHLRQHASVGGLRPEGRAGVAGTLGHQDDRKHLRPSGHTPQALHCQRLRAGAAAFEAVKTKKRQILSDLTLLLTLTAIFGPSGESRTHGLLNPIQARYQTALHPVNRAVLNQLYYYSGFEGECQQGFAKIIIFAILHFSTQSAA